MLVSNTSTIVLLAKVRFLEKTIEMLPTIEIPAQVKQEALFHRESYYARLIQNLIDEEKIKVVNVNSTEVEKIMTHFRLNMGEAAAYILFDKQKHTVILTDDGELIKLCKLEKIPFICAMAVIIRMHEKKKLTREETMKKLKELHEIGRYSQDIYEYFKRRIA